MSRQSLVILEWILFYDFTQHRCGQFQYLRMRECKAPRCLQDSLNFLYYGYGLINSWHMHEGYCSCFVCVSITMLAATYLPLGFS